MHCTPAIFSLLLYCCFLIVPTFLLQLSFCVEVYFMIPLNRNLIVLFTISIIIIIIFSLSLFNCLNYVSSCICHQFFPGMPCEDLGNSSDSSVCNGYQCISPLHSPIIYFLSLLIISQNIFLCFLFLGLFLLIPIQVNTFAIILLSK